EGVVEGPACRRGRAPTGRVAIRPHPPLLAPEHRSHRGRRAVREGQPRRDPGRRHEAAREPGGLRPPLGTPVAGGLRPFTVDVVTSRFIDLAIRATAVVTSSPEGLRYDDRA